MRITMAGVALACLLSTGACGAPAEVSANGPSTMPAPKTLQPFASEGALRRQIAAWRKAQERLQRRARAELPQAVMEAAPAAPPADAAAAAAAPEESITNVQTAGVDEGGIVKRRGDHLIVLRRGRLFTLRIGGDRLQPVSMIDAFGAGIDPSGAWYDEMLVSGNTVVVIGYSYDRGGTEIGLFDLSDDGRIAYRSTWHLRSNDYFSSRNYASRLIGDKLVFYSPLLLSLYGEDPGLDALLPGVRRWRKDQPRDAAFRRILPADRIYRAPRALDIEHGLALHTVTICDLARRDLDCRATAVMGAPGQVFYVSGDAAYVWTNPWSWNDTAGKRVSDVFRIPLDGSAPGAMQAAGAPNDQLSFLERDGHLNVLVRAQADGQWEWAAGHGALRPALLSVPLSMFADGRDVADRRHYRLLDAAPYDHLVNNRYVGDWLLVGGPRLWNGDASDVAYAVRYAGSEGFQRVQLGHGVERIEAMGGDAIMIGSKGQDLFFTSLRLAARPDVVDRYAQSNAAQGEQRTHGFFYRPIDARTGFVGLPTLGTSDRGEPTASVMFVRNRDLRLAPAGALDARGVSRPDDGCRASCVDWYGNARPIFIGERVFGLMGYEIVEGRYDGDRIVERRRVDFTPATPAVIGN